MTCGYCGHVPARWACRDQYSHKWQPACGPCAAYWMVRHKFEEIVDVLAIWSRKDRYA